MKHFLTVFAAIFVLCHQSHASVFNGDFETGDLSGWTVSFHDVVWRDASNQIVTSPLTPEELAVADIDWGFISFPYPEVQTDPAGNHVVRIDGPRDPGVGPAEYTHTDGETYYLHGTYDSSINLEQDVYLNGGDVISGAVSVETYDYWPGDGDPVVIEISDEWNTFSIWESDGNYPADTPGDNSIPWTQWEFVAPHSGSYSLSLQQFGDEQEETWSFFDDIKVQVPEPSVLNLLGASLIGIVGFRRKLKIGN